MIQYADEESDCVLPDNSIRADLSMCGDDAEEVGDDGLTDGMEAAQGTYCMFVSCNRELKTSVCR